MRKLAPLGLARLAPLVVALSFAACSSTPGSNGPPVDGAPAGVVPAAEAAPDGRLSTAVVPLEYTLDLDIDPSKPTFTGAVKIAVELKEARRRIHLHGRDTKVSAASLRRADGGTTPLSVKVLADRSLLELEAAGVMPPGPATLEIAFEAPFARSLSGLYRVEAGGDAYAFTQMEPLDARRAFPCFDEPSFKVPFSVSLVVREGDKAIANTRATGEAPAGPGKKRVTFAKSEKLPTYLVAFAVGPFDIVEAKPIPATDIRKAPLPLRGVAVRGKGGQLGFALERHTALTLELERYFGIAYPYDKLDVIAVPDFAAGAMENAGAITYREILLLVDPKSATEAQRRDVVGVASHELAHQWFGNLVTMQWWDDIWLNEAFATWMGQRAVAALHPDWKADLETLAWVHEAMGVDSVASARAIRQTIVTDDDVENAFDPLTYSKGGGLIAMYERFIGDEAFRKGVQRYLEKHRWSNANADDFLGAVFADKPELAASFRGFLDKPGVPAIQVTPRCDAGKPPGNEPVAIDVAVSRYVPLGSSATSSSPFAVPLCARAAGAKSPICGLVGQGSGASSALTTSGKDCPVWVFPNADGAAYARWTPKPDTAKALLDRGFGDLGPRERLALADSLRAGLFAGTLGTADILAALPKFAADPTREVAFAPAPTLQLLREDLATPDDRKKLEQAVVKVYGPIAQKLGWDEKPGESADDTLRRADVLDVLAFVGHHAPTRKEAQRRARVWLGLDTAKGAPTLSANVRLLGLRIAVEDGGKAVWDAALAKLQTTDDALVRRHLLKALASTNTAADAERARALVFDEKALKPSEVILFAFGLTDANEQRLEFFAWLKREMPRVNARFPEGVRGYIPSMVGRLCDAKLVPEVRAVFEPHLASMLGAPRALENAVEQIAICSAVKTKVRAK